MLGLQATSFCLATVSFCLPGSASICIILNTLSIAFNICYVMPLTLIGNDYFYVYLLGGLERSIYMVIIHNHIYIYQRTLNFTKKIK